MSMVKQFPTPMRVGHNRNVARTVSPQPGAATVTPRGPGKGNASRARKLPKKGPSEAAVLAAAAKNKAKAGK